MDHYQQTQGQGQVNLWGWDVLLEGHLPGRSISTPLSGHKVFRPEQGTESMENPVAAINGSGVPDAVLEKGVSASVDVSQSSFTEPVQRDEFDTRDSDPNVSALNNTLNDREGHLEPVAMPESGVSRNPISEVGSGLQGPITIRLPPGKKSVQDATKSGTSKVHGEEKGRLRC